METIHNKREMVKLSTALFIFLSGILIFCLFLRFAQAQTDNDPPQELRLASLQSDKTSSQSPVISMDFQDADLKDVLKIFSQQAGLNFIASEKVKDRKVTLYLDKVSVEDALSTIMNANNLIYEQKDKSKIFVVREWGKPEVETITRTYHLQYARVSGAELVGSGKVAAQATGIKAVIEQILTPHGTVVEDARTNSLIITDLPSQFDKIERTIKDLDIKLSQVMIEAEIIETNLDTIDKLGIEWGSTDEGELGAAFGASRSAKFPFTKDSSMRNIGPEGDVSGLYLGYVSATNLGGVLAMLSRDTDTKILARPRILTLNNETAEIKITADTAVAQITQTFSEEGYTTVSAERAETGISLKVTPQINKLGEITMVIEPAVVNTVQSKYFDDYVDPQTRSAKTTVIIRDKETIIIGGLINTEDSKSLRKVPFLGDIPFVGNVFRKKDDSSTDKELVIFITPHLVREGSAAKGLVLEKQTPWEYESLDLKEDAMDKILNQLEE